MVSGPLQDTFNTNGPLRGYEIFCPYDKPIEVQKKITIIRQDFLIEALLCNKL